MKPSIDRDAARAPELRAEPEPRTYYDLPVLKPAPWRWYIPMYFHTGGVAGASAVIGAAASLGGLPRLAHRAHLLALAGDLASAGLLVADLGRPARFLDMLRVVRPTSPMSVGSWLLTGAGATGALAIVRPRLASVPGAIAGAMLTTYTAVLLGNTATPIWRAVRRSLPHLFGASAAAAAVSALELFPPPSGREGARERRTLAVLGGVARVAELVGHVKVARDLRGEVGAPLERGRAAALWRTSIACGIGALVATFVPGRAARIVRGVLGTAASVAMRAAIVDAGKRSARDPRAATVTPRPA
jgi:hypothetical protein